MRSTIACVLGSLILCLSVGVSAQVPNTSWGLYRITEGATTPLLITQEDIVRPMASLTKLMTAWITLTSGPPLTQTVVITAQDTANASTTVLRNRDHVSLRDLLYLMLVSSDNVAARALARTVEGTRTSFVVRMNQEAQRLDMTHTRYADPAGLLATNVSTTNDLTRLLHAVSTTPLLADAFHTQTYTAVVRRNNRLRRLTVNNTNRLLDDTVQISKTGFTSSAGYCLVQWITTANDAYVAVILGAPSKEYRRGLMQALMQFTQQWP